MGVATIVRNRKVFWGSVLLLSLTMMFGAADLVMAEGVLHQASGHTPAFPNFYVIGWTLVDFLILLALLYKFAFNPVKTMLEQRTETIEGNLNHAEELKQEMEQLKGEAEAALIEARQESQAIIIRAQQTAEETQANMIASAEADIAAMKAKAEREIAEATEEARQQLREDAANLAIMAAEKLLERSITEEDNLKFVKEFVNEAGDLVC